MSLDFMTGNAIVADKIVAHACNCQGVWGSGIAAQIKAVAPNAFRVYERHCRKLDGDCWGTALLIESDGVEPSVLCLFTSRNYGAQVDNPDLILDATRSALSDAMISLPHDAEVTSPQFNAGLFHVPWEQTEALLREALETREDLEWTVYVREEMR